MAMITEDYVSFETAKLLKEKGFDCGCACINHPQCGMALIGHMITNTGLQLTREYELCIDKKNFLTIPTLQMAMKWLREVHDLNINNELLIHGYFCSISHIVRDSSGYIIDVEDSEAWETAYYETYEEACEEAIKYCLENLI